MKKPNKFGTYICPHGKGNAIQNLIFKQKTTVSGRYCKNNCEKYLKDCKRWKKKS